jgi:peptide/nickel transport system permease protein
MPNALSPIIVQSTLNVARAIISSSTLSFLGLGVQTPTPEWGSMLAVGRSYIQLYPHMIMIPGIAIFITTYALNLFGDGLRDALDPRLKN